ncbi:MAG: adenylate/guanylate cyclase domain-containing protein [Actinomycetota bacterium]
MSSVPENPRLAEIARELERTGWASVLCDESGRLVWASPEIKTLLGEEDEGKLGYGRPLFAAYLSEPWFNSVTESTRTRLFLEVLPRLLGEGGITKKVLRKMIPEQFLEALEQVVPVNPPPLWSNHIEFLHRDLPPTDVNYVSVRLTESDGTKLGTAILYGSALPASILALVARGDRGAFERMARLFNPGRRAAAVLFADLQLSGMLSRRLSSAAYFNLIRTLTTSIDEIVVRRTGIVGKHAGDGVTAFFLSHDLGSPSRAARAAIEAAREISASTETVTLELKEEFGSIEPADCLINLGLHWGDTLYMGQLITGGRLEVTALGDAVIECARIQESARNGQLLVSKSLVEQLAPDDAHSLLLDPDAIRYVIVSELPEATDKAVRDAGGIPVAPL